MDYSNGITVFIGNEGFYAEGELRDRAITLPVSGSELQGFLEGNGLVTPMHEETYIADFLDRVPFDHPEIFAHATAEQMNILAQQLKMADPDDLDKVQDWIDAFDTPKNIVELMNLVEDAESINRVEYEFSTNGPTIPTFRRSQNVIPVSRSSTTGRSSSMRSLYWMTGSSTRSALPLI